ncbi:MAG TPA: NIPSNAP family protein [Pseudolabrys sp.]|nr:NIPSNAP family protein [Pseudolabrys sp.]
MPPHTIFELRRYRLRPGGREPLIALFDREFVAPQEALGMRVEGEFRDAGDPDAFVWLRSFADMQTRTEALRAFYSGPVWQAFGSAANATMLNSDNVLLLRPAGATAPFAHNRSRAREQGVAPPAGVVVANICSLAPGTEDRAASFFAERARPVLERHGARIDAVFVTERSANGFPRLPVREGETVLVWLECHADSEALDDCRARLAGNAAWTDEIYPALDAQCWRRIETADLTPTSRSLCAW